MIVVKGIDVENYLSITIIVYQDDWYIFLIDCQHKIVKFENIRFSVTNRLNVSTYKIQRVMFLKVV